MATTSRPLPPTNAAPPSPTRHPRSPATRPPTSITHARVSSYDAMLPRSDDWSFRDFIRSYGYRDSSNAPISNRQRCIWSLTGSVSSTRYRFVFFFFFNDTAPPEISPLPLPDALPIYPRLRGQRRDRLRSTGRAADRVRADGLVAREPPRLLREEQGVHRRGRVAARRCADRRSDPGDRKSTRLNSSHDQISYAVFCLKK